MPRLESFDGDGRARVVLGVLTDDFLELTRKSRDPYVVYAKLRVRAHPWSGEFDITFSAGELSRLAAALTGFHQTLADPVEYRSQLGGNLCMKFSADRRGWVNVRTQAAPKIAFSTLARLHFELHFDQSYLPGLAEDLRRFDIG